MNRLPSILATIATVVLAMLGASAGIASANENFPDANCDGLTFDMPRSEDGTIVTVTLDGIAIREYSIAVFGSPLRFTIPTPDRTVPHTWTVLVDSPYRLGEVPWTETVPVCPVVAPPPVPTTTSPSTTAPTTTTSPAPTTTSIPTAPATRTPPAATATTAPSTPVVVTSPRPPAAATTPPSPTLPATGPDVAAVALVAAAALTAGLAARRAGRRSS